MLKKLAHILRWEAIVLASFVGLAGCGGACGSNTSPSVNKTPITIDNAGVVPVFANSSTTTVVYIHNNSNSNISGISYSSSLNSAKEVNTTASKLLKLVKNTTQSTVGVASDQCTSIAAGQSCPLQITTPILSGGSTQGAMNIQAHYKINNQALTFNQIINYALVQNNQPAGAKFQSGANISGYGNATGYATLYLYGSGQDQIYDVSSITINKPAVTIVNGNISGHQIQSYFVQAVEVSSPIINSSISATITVNSSTASAVNKAQQKKLNAAAAQYSNSVDITVQPANVGAILTTSSIPVINTNNTTTGSMIVQNIGDQDALVQSITADSGINNLSGCSGATLAPAASCQINFSVSNATGNGNIIVTYSGGSASSVVGNVTWSSGPQVAMSASTNPLSFIATTSGSATIMVTNNGAYALNNISIPNPVIISGSATAQIANNTCANQSLAIGASCSYDVTVSDNVLDLNRQISLGFNANYTANGSEQSYSQSLLLSYNSTTDGAIIVISPVNPTLTISGNTLESNTQILTISNNGNLTTGISTQFESQPFLTESATTCGASLAANQTCTSTIQFGPTFSAIESTGSTNYVVNYAASGQVPAGSVTSTIDWTIQGYDQSISLVQQYATGAASGNGESSSTPYVFNMTTPGVNQEITLVYKNTGTHAMKLTGIQDLNYGVVWQMENSSTCNPGTTILESNQMCSIVYRNVVESNIFDLNAFGQILSSNLVLPRLVYQDVTNGVQFNWSPNLSNGDIFISTQFNIATVSNIVTLNNSGSANETVTVAHILANVDDASTITVVSQMEDYFDNIAVVESAGCSSSSANGIMTQTCSLNKNTLSSSSVYQVNQAYLSDQNLCLNILFSVDEQTTLAYMSSLSASIDLGTAPPIYAYVTDYGDDAIAMFSLNPSNGMLTPLSQSTIATGYTPNDIAIDSVHKYAYVTRGGSAANNVLMYSILESGVLAPLSPESVGDPNSLLATSIVYSPFGAVYAGSMAGDLSMYSQNSANGGLAPLSPSFVNAGESCLGLSINPPTQTLYSACQDGHISSYAIESVSGQLTNITALSGIANSPQYIAATPNGRYVYATTAESILMYSSTQGTLTALDTASLALTSSANKKDHYIAIHPSGKFAYVVNTLLDTISMYQINQQTGVLTALSPATVNTDNNPFSLAFDPSGKFAYVANTYSSTIGIYSVNPSSGVLTLVNTINVATPQRIVFSY